MSKVGRPKAEEHIRVARIKESQKKYRSSSEHYKEYQRLYKLKLCKKEVIDKFNIDPESDLYQKIMDAEFNAYVRHLVSGL
jgi:hypothetical protein